MKSIDSDIKNQKIRNIYLLMGVEPYLMYQYRDKLVHALVGPDDEINYKKYSGEIPDINAVIEYADTVPFFAERKVLVLEDTRIFKSSDDRLATYLEQLPETTYIIFVECYSGSRSEEYKYEQTLIDKRYKLYKTVQKNGRVIEFKRTDEGMLQKWLLKKFSDAGLNITRNAMGLLLEYAHDDMMMLNNEAEKIISYRLGHSSIDAEDVSQICTRNIEDHIFDMVGAITVKNRHKALRLYYDLTELKESPLKMLALIAREFNLLMLVKGIRSDGGGKDLIVKSLKISPWQADRYISLSGRYDHDYFKKALTDCIETEKLIKQGLLKDDIGVEMLIIKYAS